MLDDGRRADPRPLRDWALHPVRAPVLRDTCSTLIDPTPLARAIDRRRGCRASCRACTATTRQCASWIWRSWRGWPSAMAAVSAF
jgi:hypothetical protein